MKQLSRLSVRPLHSLLFKEERHEYEELQADEPFLLSGSCCILSSVACVMAPFQLGVSMVWYGRKTYYSNAATWQTLRLQATTSKQPRTTVSKILRRHTCDTQRLHATRGRAS